MDVSPCPKSLVSSAREAAKVWGISVVLAAVVLLLLPRWLQYVCMISGALLIITQFIVPLVIKWKPKERIEVSGKSIVITGCDTGFGHMLAQRMDDLGFQVFAGCLFPEGEGAKKLRKSGSDRLHILGLDVTKDDDFRKAVDYVNNNLHGRELWALVCNAGINDGGEILWTNMDTIQRVVDINTFGVVRATKAFLPQICKSHGRVVTVASMAGRYSFPGMIPYCMSKHSTVSFCEALRMEMYRWRVKVVTIEPFVYKTAIADDVNLHRAIDRAWSQAPEDIKASFPPGYIDIYKKISLDALNKSVSRNLNEVIDCLEEAIVSKEPRYSYRLGSLKAKSAYFFYSNLPKEMADFVIATFLGFDVSSMQE